jgi:hypothetical protein
MSDSGLELAYVTKIEKAEYSARFRVRGEFVQVKTYSDPETSTAVSWTRIQIPLAEWQSIVSFIAAEIAKAAGGKG